MAPPVYETFPRDQVTEAMLGDASKLFSENYAIWGEHSGKHAGNRVKESAHLLQERYFPDAAASFYTRVIVDGHIVGHALTCRWECDGKNVCWVTQLVVEEAYRERGLATGMLKSLRKDSDHIYGILSSNPAACLAAARAFGSNIENVPLNFISENAGAVIKASPIPYVRDAKLHGTIFEPGSSTGLVSGVDTNFFINHEVPLGILERVRRTRQWPLGDLPEGHEFLLILQAK